MSLCKRDITKEIVHELQDTPIPQTGKLLQIRSGKVEILVNEPSGIFKKPVDGKVFITKTGIQTDKHVYPPHGGTERAIMAYDVNHYADWRLEKSSKPELFSIGAFGENFVMENLTESNVCIGDIIQVGQDVLLEVSEPRNPCYKLNLRFEWNRALKRITRTARVGWLMRVIKTGYVEAGDQVQIIERPYPRWSCLNVKRVIQGKEVSLELLQELVEVKPLTEMVRNYAIQRIASAEKRYKLQTITPITNRVKKFTFQLDEPIKITEASFKTFAFAQINFGDEKLEQLFKRSYSIVSGDLNCFSLGISLDQNSRGGSRYVHEKLKIGDQITMRPGGNPKDVEDEDKCVTEGLVKSRIVIIGGIGVTAFLPIMSIWEDAKVPYEVHYAVKSRADAPFLHQLSSQKTTVYAKDEGNRLDLNKIIPQSIEGVYTTRVYCCGPTGLMNGAERRTTELGYPDHLVHFEAFGADSGIVKGDPFTVNVKDVENDKQETLEVSSDKTLLQVLREAGYDMTSLCEVGGCGACQVNICSGKIDHKGTALYDSQKEKAMLSCVSRGIGTISIELD